MQPTFAKAALRRVAAAGLAALMFGALPARSNNIGENASWGFQTSTDKTVRANNLDLQEKKRAGYYDSIKTIVTNNTYIEHQTNCSLSASSVGNTGSNGMTSYASSPVVTSSASTSAGSSANGASNSTLGASGLFGSGTGLTNSQSNSGSLYSTVNGGSTLGTTGNVGASGGTSSQVLNSAQTSSGILTAGVSNSSACAGTSY